MLTVKQEVDLESNYTDTRTEMLQQHEENNKIAPEFISGGMIKNGRGSSFVYCVGGDEQTSQHSLKSERGFPVFHCDQCEYETFSLATLSSHRKTHAVKKLFQCDICHMKFSQAANMRRHRMRHTGIKPYECRICCKRFFRKDHLMEHTVTHAKQPPFRCPLCGKDFHRQTHLRDHLSVEHNNDNSSVTTPSLADRVCRVCGHRAATVKGAKLHYISRHNRKSTSLLLPTSPKPNQSKLEEEQNNIPPTSAETASNFFCYLQNAVNYPSFAFPSTDILNRSFPAHHRTSSSPPPHQVSQVSSVDGSSSTVVVKKEPDPPPSCESEEEEKKVSSPGDVVPDSSRVVVIGGINCESSLSRIGSLSPSAVGSGLQCCHCGIIFPDQTLYFLHKGLHSEGNPWKCNICGELCQDKYEFNAHVLSKAHQ